MANMFLRETEPDSEEKKPRRKNMFETEAAAQAPAEEEQPISGEGLAAAAGTGLVRGTAGLAGAAGDINSLIDYVSKKIGAPPERVHQVLARTPMFGPMFAAMRRMPTTEDVTGAFEQHVMPLHRAQNPWEQRVENVASFIPGALAGPGSLAGTVGRTAVRGGINALTFGLLPGAAAEAAGYATQGTRAEPFARAAAAIGTAGLGGLAASKTAMQKAREGLPEFMTKTN